MNDAPLKVLAYDHTGNMRVSHEVQAGDLVDWKQNGTTGSYRCEVEDAWRSPSGRTMLHVALLSHDGRLIDGRPVKKITGSNVLAVYHPDGRRKEPVRQ